MMIEEETVQACENIVRHAETNGAELFEKNFIKGDQILATVFCVVGQHAEEVTALVREWANANLKRHKDGE